MKKPIVIKVGGSFFTELKRNGAGPTLLFKTLAILQKQKQPVVLVHGGGEQVQLRLTDLGFSSLRKNGLRVSPDAQMPIVCSVLAGELNKQLVANAAQYSINAVGICLADGDIAICHEKSPDLGAVGEPAPYKSDLLNALFSVNMLPIVASIGKDTKGRLYNVNADHAAICIAELLNTQLYFLADVHGVLDENKHLIHQLNKQGFESMVDKGVITDGMIIKVEAALQAAKQIQHPVTIASWENSYALLVEHQQCGTQIMPAYTTNINAKEKSQRD